MAPFATVKATEPVAGSPPKEPLYVPRYEPSYLPWAGVGPNTVEPAAKRATMAATCNSEGTRYPVIFIFHAPGCDCMATSSFEARKTPRHYTSPLVREAVRAISYAWTSRREMGVDGACVRLHGRSGSLDPEGLDPVDVLALGNLICPVSRHQGGVQHEGGCDWRILGSDDGATHGGVSAAQGRRRSLCRERGGHRDWPVRRSRQHGHLSNASSSRGIRQTGSIRPGGAGEVICRPRLERHHVDMTRSRQGGSQQKSLAPYERAAAIYFATPNNPDGAMLSEAELVRILELAERRGLWILADEVYEDYGYDAAHVSIASLPGAAERTITVFSFAKSYAQAGLRVGYAVAADRIAATLKKLVNHSVYNVPVAMQRAAFG